MSAALPAGVRADSDASATGNAIPVAQLGLWLFLASEILFFGALLLAYGWARAHWPRGFALASRHTDVLIGTLNTAVLLASSVAAALAVLCAQTPLRRHGTRPLLWATAALGVLFLALKGVEWHAEALEGLLPGPGFALAAQPGAQLFFVWYFVATGLHALHLGAGVGTMAWLALRRPTAPARVDAAALYWHFVDLVWVFLYPLIYLVERHG